MRFYFGALFLLGVTISCFAQTENQGMFSGTEADSLRIERAVDKADSLNKVGKTRESIELMQKMVSRAQAGGGPHLIELTQHQLAVNYLRAGQTQKAETLLKSILEKYPESEKKVEVISLLGYTYGKQGKLKQALQKVEAAVAMVDSASQPKLYGQVQLNLGSVYEDRGETGKALTAYLNSLNSAEQRGDSLLLATVLNNIGVTYNGIHEPEKARSYIERALSIDGRTGDKIGILRALNNLAISESQLGNLEKATGIYRRALVLHQEVRPDVPPVRILYNLAQAYKEQGELDKAVTNYRQSLDYSRKAGIAQGLIYNYGGLANVEELRNNFDRAYDYYNKALDVAKEIKAKSLQKEALNSLYLLEKNRGDYRKALSYFERYTALSDSLNTEAQKHQIDKIETELGLKRQQEVNALLQEKQDQQEARLRVQTLANILGGAIILIIGISLFFLYRTNREKQRMNEELATQKNRLQELNKVKDKMVAIIAHDLRSPLASIHGMLFLLREKELSPEEIQMMTAKLDVSIAQNINMIDNLLVWARKQMSGLDIKTKALNATEITAQVMGSFEFRATHKKIQLSNKVPPGMMVKADENLFKLILRNLIDNSLKFSDEGDTISVRASRNNGKVILEVRDTGIGMPQEIREHIFLGKAESRTGTQQETGSGLGLQLCKEFVEKQHGRMEIESEEGVGTSFIFDLPSA